MRTGGSRAIGGDDAKMSKDSLEGQQTEVVVSRLVKNGGWARVRVVARSDTTANDARALRVSLSGLSLVVARLLGRGRRREREGERGGQNGRGPGL